MAEEKKNKGIGLPQTRGSFNLKGIITGTKKNSFYKTKETKKDKKPLRLVNFGVTYMPNKTLYLNLKGMEKPEVFFSKKEETEDGKKKTIVERASWANRFNFKKDGFRLIGINLGITKKTLDNGKVVNDNKTLTEFDACDHIGKNLTDGVTVFTKGTIEFSSFKSGEDIKRNVRLIPTQISLGKDISFEAEDFKPENYFTQVIIFMGMKKDDSNPKDIKGIVSAKIVTYNTIEDAEFITRNSIIIKNFRKLKPFTAIEVSGKIDVKEVVQEVKDNGYWGEENEMKKISKPVERELEITGANPSSVDTTTYSEEKITEALRASKEYGEPSEAVEDEENGSWGEENEMNNGSEETTDVDGDGDIPW